MFKRFHLCAWVLLFVLASLGRSAGAARLTADAETLLSEMSAQISRSLTSSPTSSSSSVFCNFFGVAPDYFPWTLRSSDVDGAYVVLKYTFDQAPANLPKTIVFAWHRGGLYAPWIVYYTRETISDEIKISADGDVAFWRTEPVGPSQTVAQTELRVCSLNSNNLASQLGAYSCASDIHTGAIAEVILHNASTSSLFGILTNQPDGRFMELDWSGDRLFFSRMRQSTLVLSLEFWDQFTQTSTLIDSTSTSSSTPGEYWINQADSNGVVGFNHFDIAGLLTGSAAVTVKGVAPSQGPSGLSYGAPNFSDRQQGFLGSARSAGFFSMGGELHSIYVPQPSLGLNSPLMLRSSADNYFSMQPAIALPAGKTFAYRPMRISSQIFGELLLIQSGATSGPPALEVYQYLPSGIPGVVGSYSHLETVSVPAGFTQLTLDSATDVPLWGGAMVLLGTSSSVSPRHALVSCI
ncbi:MAG: hypothetical protein ACK5QT_05170 [Oligoflexia bacterium]